MSTLIYNCVQIEVIQTVRYVREPVYEGKTYVYSRHFVHVRGLVNPGSTSYDYQQQTTDNVVGGSANPNFSRRGVNKTRNLQPPAPGNNANVTDQVIRHLLQQPRRKLLYTCGGNDPTGNPAQIQFTFVGGAQDTQILEAPYRNRGGDPPQYTVDCNNGPFPRLWNVTRVDGTGMFRVEFAVECFVNEAHLYLLKPPLLLCNEYEMQHDIDRDGYCTQSVRGVARFRADVLATLQTTPDDYRKFLCMDVPRGFQRQNLRVRARADGATVDYQYTDRQESHSLFYVGTRRDPARTTGHTRIEAFATVSQGKEALEKQLEQVGRGVFGAAVAAGGAALGAAAGGLGLGATAAAAGRAGAGAALGSSFYVGDLVPQKVVDLVVRVWGGPWSHRADLFRLCDYICFAKVPQLLDPFVRYSATRTRVTLDLVGRFVQVEKTAAVGGLTRAVSEMVGMGFQDLPGLFADDEIVVPAEVTKGAPIRVATVGIDGSAGRPQPDLRWPNAVPPQNDQTRSLYTRLCVAAALSSWQDGPAVPPPGPPSFNPNVTPTY
jgi:hypothetical protein